MADETQPLITTEVTVPEYVDPAEVTYAERLTKSKGILSGETWIQLTLQFLYSHNKSDLLILKTKKQSIEMRNSVCHSATIYANALMHAGTTVDTFLRENLDWLSRATNWAKFSTTAGLGVLHRGHLQQGRSLMAPYLPQSGSGGGSPYFEGGALYALGLIYANHGGGSGSNSGESITAPGGG
ncbi:putative armadillo-like helical protein [Helianthus debilis subsp. tardiflorus]